MLIKTRKTVISERNKVKSKILINNRIHLIKQVRRVNLHAITFNKRKKNIFDIITQFRLWILYLYSRCHKSIEKTSDNWKYSAQWISIVPSFPAYGASIKIISIHGITVSCVLMQQASNRWMNINLLPTVHNQHQKLYHEKTFYRWLHSH